jgi:CarboxypepD_reg-like domain/Carboxypeptidase regulatory-like domain
MNSWQVARHQVAIAGRVTDGETGKPMARVPVSIIGMPAVFRKKLDLLAKARGTAWASLSERPDQTQTRDDGLFWFIDLPNGKYSLSAEVPKQGSRYGKAHQSVTVARDANGDVNLAASNFALPPTGLRGKVTGAGHKAGVTMAEVRLKGSGEYTHTDGQGQYSLSRIESGKRTILVVAQGYKIKEQPVTLEKPGASLVADFNLVRETS